MKPKLHEDAYPEGGIGCNNPALMKAQRRWVLYGVTVYDITCASPDGTRGCNFFYVATYFEYSLHAIDALL